MTQRTFMITGASKGIGLATAKRLAAAGHQSIGFARTEPDDYPGDFHQVDLSDEQATGQAIEKAIAGRQIDGVVNNVGLVRGAALGDITHQDLRDVLDLNLRVTVQMTQAVIDGMKKRKWGRIVNVSSLTVVGAPWRASYAAAKAGLVAFTRSWALELAAEGICVNAVAPGPTETELFSTNNPPGSESRDRYVGLVPMQRIADPDEVAGPIMFLLSDDASFITGQTLFIDGGSSVGRVQV